MVFAWIKYKNTRWIPFATLKFHDIFTYTSNFLTKKKISFHIQNWVHDAQTLWVLRVLKYTKSVWRIWQHFSCPLEEGIPKVWNKLNSHDGFLSYLQNSIANSAHLAAHFCPALVCPQKATVRIQFLPYFWNSLIK